MDATNQQLGVPEQRHVCFLTIDNQRSPFSEAKLVAFCSTAQDLGTPVPFRIENTSHAYLVGNILDLGSAPIEFPLVEYEAVVNEALEALYYPPFGYRS